MNELLPERKNCHCRCHDYPGVNHISACCYIKLTDSEELEVLNECFYDLKDEHKKTVRSLKAYKDWNDVLQMRINKYKAKILKLEIRDGI